MNLDEIKSDKNLVYNIRLAEEKDFKKLVGFINKHDPRNSKANDGVSMLYVNPLINNNSYFRELALRDSLYNFREEFILVEQDDEIQGMLTINIPYQGRSLSANVSFFVFPCHSEMLFDAIDFAVEQLPIHAIVAPTKLRLLVSHHGTGKENLLELITKAGFCQEIVLKNELGFDKDILSYVRYIPETICERCI